jgi:hypothetical protein
MFGRKRSLENDGEPIDSALTFSLKDSGQTRPCKDEKYAKRRGKFIKWSLSSKEQSLNSPTLRIKAFNKRKVSQKLVLTGTTFIE